MRTARRKKSFCEESRQVYDSLNRREASELGEVVSAPENSDDGMNKEGEGKIGLL